MAIWNIQTIFIRVSAVCTTWIFYMKIFFGVSFFFLIIMGNAFAQVGKEHNSWIWGPSIGYQYQKANFLKASFWGLTDVGYANYLRFDAGANMTWRNSKTYIIPELGATYYLGAKGVWPFVKAELTPYTVTPKIGVGLFNIVEVGVGYGMELGTKEQLGAIKGLNFSLGLSMPINYHLY